MVFCSVEKTDNMTSLLNFLQKASKFKIYCKLKSFHPRLDIAFIHADFDLNAKKGFVLLAYSEVNLMLW